MKYYIFTFIFLVLPITNLFGQLKSAEDLGFGDDWKYMNIDSDFPTLNFIQEIDFADSLNGMMAVSLPFANNPAVLKTTDGGLTWNLVWIDSTIIEKDPETGEAKYLHKSLPPYRIIYVNPDTCMLLCSDVNNGDFTPYLSRTTDEGDSWKIYDLPYHNLFASFKMYDEKFGALLSYGKTMLLTHDGGETWEPFDKYPDDFMSKGAWSFQGLSIPDSNSLYIYAVDFNDNYKAYLLKTTDMGETWSDSDMPEFSPGSHFINKNTGWNLSFKRNDDKLNIIRIFKTTDAGENWTTQLDSLTAWKNMDVATWDFYDDKTCILTFAWKSVLLTRDGGENWTSLTPNSLSKKVSLIDIAFCSRYHAVAVDRIYHNIYHYFAQTTGIRENNPLNFNNILAYPNPFASLVTIKIEGKLIDPVLTLTDVLGNISVVDSYTIINENTISIPTGSLPEGVYFITIKTGGKTYMKKIIKSGF